MKLFYLGYRVIYRMIDTIYIKCCDYYEKIKYKGNVEFGTTNMRDELYYINTDYESYQASFIPQLYYIIRKLHINEFDNILDIGCGKGKTLYKFSKLPFNQVDGVELSKELSEIAKKNCEYLKLRSRVFTENILDFDKLDEYNYFYLYNPFGEDTMQKVINKIECSIKEKPRQVTIIYLNPLCDKIITANGIFKTVKVHKNIFNHYRNIIVYCNK